MIGNPIVAGYGAPVYFRLVPLMTVYGHAALRERLVEAVRRNALPASLLLQGPRGVGKQQLALWLARALLCENRQAAPCGKCRSCRMAAELQHPDLHWFFPRPRHKDSDPNPAEVREDMADAIRERLGNHGLYEPPGGDFALYLATVRAIVQTALLSPAMGQRKVFVIGDAERMVAQEGSDQAANAFLKLLEEPPADTTLILTSSEPGALLPTIRSRTVAIRVAPLADAEVKAFLADDAVKGQLDAPRDTSAWIRLASGAPGRLVAREAWEAALNQARRLLEAARSPDRGSRMRVALAQGASGARGKYAETLEALSVLLHERSVTAAERGDDIGSFGAARAMEAVEATKELADGNVNPQLLTASLLQEIAPFVR